MIEEALFNSNWRTTNISMGEWERERERIIVPFKVYSMLFYYRYLKIYRHRLSRLVMIMMMMTIINAEHCPTMMVSLSLSLSLVWVLNYHPTNDLGQTNQWIKGMRQQENNTRPVWLEKKLTGTKKKKRHKKSSPIQHHHWSKTVLNDS